MEDNFQKMMFEWTELDKHLKKLNHKASDIRKQKDHLQGQLCDYIQENQLEDNIFSLPSLERNVSFKKQTTSESISYKFLEEKMNSYFKTSEEAQSLLQYIKENRKKETNVVLKSSILKQE